MLIEIPVRLSVKMWYEAVYGTGTIKIRRNTRILGPLMFSYFSQYAIGGARVASPFNFKDETIEFDLPFDVSMTLLDDKKLEAFGAVLECVSDVYRFGFVDGFTDVMPSFNTSIRRWIKKYNLESLPEGDVTSGGLLKDAHRFHENMVIKSGAKKGRKGFGTGNSMGSHLPAGLAENTFSD